MSDGFDPSLRNAVANVVMERTGLRFAADRHADLERGVRAAARELGFPSALACAEWLVSSVASNYQVRILASYLTIGETYFFREKASFQFMEQRLFPELITARRGHDRRLRIWSAGCCTGEEPYSIALLLSQLLPDPTGWQIHILGTDINEHFLNKAREANYGEWSFRETPPAIVEKCFAPADGGRYRLVPSVHCPVTFAPLNLIDDVYPSPANGTQALDLILCRNVLIYIEAEQAKKIVRNLSRCLVDGGWLLVGAAEGAQIALDDLEPAEVAGVMAFRKGKPGAVPRRRVLHLQGQTASPLSKPTPPVADRIEEPRRSPRPSAADRVQQSLANAENAFSQRRYADVVVDLIPLCTTGLGEARAMALLARAYANQGRQAEALAWCEKAIGAEKLDPRLYYLKASIHQEQGEIDQAAAALRRAIYLDPDFVMAHVSAGHLAGRLGRRKESDRHFATARRLLERHPMEQEIPEAEGIDARQLGRLISANPLRGEPNE